MRHLPNERRGDGVVHANDTGTVFVTGHYFSISRRGGNYECNNATVYMDLNTLDSRCTDNRQTILITLSLVSVGYPTAGHRWARQTPFPFIAGEACRDSRCVSETGALPDPVCLLRFFERANFATKEFCLVEPSETVTPRDLCGHTSKPQPATQTS